MTYYSKIFLLFISIFFLITCKKEAKKAKINPKDKEIKYCINTNDLLGKNYLDTKLLKAIDAIKTSSKKKDNTTGMVAIKGGVFSMGGDFSSNHKKEPKTANPQPDELPKHLVEVSNFLMDEHEVTIGQFLEFIEATGYKTVAEYDIDWEEIKKQLPPNTPKPEENVLKAGALVFSLVNRNVSKDNLSNWWHFTKGAHWKNPDGTSKELKTILNLPVTQVSWYDAMAYAKWVGKRLPTEAEFEYAMRGGLKENLYPWGNEKTTTNPHKGNFLQGEFPYTNTGEDGFVGLAPVKSFPPNNYGLYDISGNVWEWTNDWYGASYYDALQKQNKISKNPLGPEKTEEVYNTHAINKVVRGGSFLCNDTWCSGFRNARRMRLSPDSGMQHLGFRLVRSSK